MKVLSVNKIGNADVYNLLVPDTHNFLIQGGIVSHNCDAIRYFCMSRPIEPRIIKEKYEPISDPLNQFGGNSQNSVFARYGSIRG